LQDCGRCGAKSSNDRGFETLTGELIPVAGANDQKNKNCDHRSDDEHPVLAIEAKKRKVLDQKMQRPRAPLLRAE
jgi:hypothetical protein